jgi:DNA-binding response OmpR family regulator
MPDTPVTGGKKILIVEDEKPLAHALELKMQREGYEVTTALTGQDGLNLALTGNFSLILLDLIMPQLDGFAVLQGMREKNIQSSVIVLSNLGQDEDQKKAKELGAVEYYVKANTPISQIVQRIKQLLP